LALYQGSRNKKEQRIYYKVFHQVKVFPGRDFRLFTFIAQHLYPSSAFLRRVPHRNHDEDGVKQAAYALPSKFLKIFIITSFEKLALLRSSNYEGLAVPYEALVKKLIFYFYRPTSLKLRRAYYTLDQLISKPLKRWPRHTKLARA